ncbi:TPA: hypothetical protein DEG75_01165 [Candidatus Dependentiae bacterium]|nr:hypothetical protein [Candidatus Dependentiae bacterium]
MKKRSEGMSGYRGHTFGAFALVPCLIFLGSWVGFSLPTLLSGVLVVFLGALFPDIDTAGRGRRFFLGCICICILACTSTHALWTAGVCAFIGLLALVSRHRTLFHNIYFLLFLTICVAAWSAHLLPQYTKELWWIAFCFVIGCFSHMLLDFGVKRSLSWR